MKSEKEIKEQIKKTTNGYKHVLECYPATIQINSPRALMQLTATTTLDTLYWVLDQKRPKFKCDDWSKKNQ